MTSLTAEDDAQAFFFVRWCVREADPGHERLGAWFAALERGEDRDASLKAAFGRSEENRILEAFETVFRYAGQRLRPSVPGGLALAAQALRSGVPERVRAAIAEDAMAAAPPVPIEGGTNTLEVRLSVTWELD